MHPYGIDTQQRRSLIIWLIVISFIMSPVVGAIFDAFKFTYPSVLQYVVDIGSSAGIFYLLVSLVDNSLWRMEWFRRIFRVSVPDMNGTWVGDLHSSYNDFKVAYPITLVIRQDWSEISIKLMREQGSGSHSTTASVLLRADVVPIVTYTYHNDPLPDQVETMHAHDGTAELSLEKEGSRYKLEGTYYTGRDRRTFGRMRLERVEVTGDAGDRAASGR